MADHVILVRQGSPRFDALVEEAERGLEGFRSPEQAMRREARFTGDPTQVTLALAGRLADECKRGKFRVGRILYGEDRVARETAELYAAVLRRRKRFDGEPEPRVALTHGRASEECELIDELTKPGERADLLVGSRPALSGIANVRHVESSTSGVPSEPVISIREQLCGAGARSALRGPIHALLHGGDLR